MYVVLLFFFFQAEDGIRDSSVTGVQTCALPISSWRRSWRPRRERGPELRLRRWPAASIWWQPPGERSLRQHGNRRRAARGDRESGVEGKSVELGGRRIIKKKKKRRKRQTTERLI